MYGNSARNELNNITDKAEKARGETPHEGHRDRMREKFRTNGFNGMNDHEILEMILYHSIPRKDTNRIAHNLINSFGSFAGVLEATEDQLKEVEGVTPNSAFLLSMILPILNVYSKRSSERIKLKTPEECGEFLKMQLQGKQKECVVLMCLSSACTVLYVGEICDGDARNVVVNIRKIVEIVLKYPKTAAVLLAHNHPGGLALPSRDDISATTEIRKLLGAMNINLVDHIIVTDEDYISMATSGGFTQIFK